MKDLEFIAKQKVTNWHQSNVGANENGMFIREEDVRIVWFCKTLQNWKAICSPLGDERFYEVTYNGDKKECYIDVYKKEHNCISFDIS